MPATSLLDAREGRTQTDVLAAIAKAQFRGGSLPRQSDLDDALPVSKGAVSNNCGKLVETGLVRKREDRRYEIVTAELLALYREHVDRHLAREGRSERFADQVAAHNEARTDTKRRLRELFDDNEVLVGLLAAALVDALDDSRIQTVREVLLHADRLAYGVVTHVVTHPDFDGPDDPAWETVAPLVRVAVATNRVHAGLDAIAEEISDIAPYLPGETPAATMTTALSDDT